MPLQIALAAEIYSCGTNHEIVIYHKCRVVSSTQLGTSSLRIKCERKGFFIKLINKEYGLYMPPPGIRCWQIQSG
jgi:hypothetical protein